LRRSKVVMYLTKKNLSYYNEGVGAGVGVGVRVRVRVSVQRGTRGTKLNTYIVEYLDI